MALHLGEFDDQNRVLAGQAHQHYEPDTREYVDIHLGNADARNRAEQAHRHDQDDSQGQRPALVLRGQHQEYHDHGAAKDDHGGIAGQQFEVRHVRPLVGHILRQLFIGQTLHGSNGVAGTDSGAGSAVDGSCRVHVVTRQDERSLDLMHRGQRSQGRHAAFFIADLKQGKILDPFPEWTIRLDIDLPGAAKEIEIVDVQRSQKDLQRVFEALDFDAALHALAQVGLDVKLRHVGTKHRKESNQLRLAVWSEKPRGLLRVGLVTLATEVFNLLLQSAWPRIATVFDHDGKAAGSAHAPDGRWWEDGQRCPQDLLGELIAQVLGDGVAGKRRIAPLAVPLKVDKHRAEVGPEGVQHERLARDRRGVLDSLRIPGDLSGLLHYFLSAFGGSRVRKLHIHHQVTHVLRWDEPLGGRIIKPPGYAQKPSIKEKHNDRPAQHQTDRSGIDTSRETKAAVELSKRPAQGDVPPAPNQTAGQDTKCRGHRLKH